MLNHEFELLKIRASVVPQAETWPKPDYSKVSISVGDKPTTSGVALHWDKLHSAVKTARDAVTSVAAKVAATDEDKKLSPAGKADAKRRIAEAALADLEKSKSLENARTSVEAQVAKWNRQIGLTPKVPESIGAAMLQTETRSYLASLKSGERMAFINAHSDEVAEALLNAPSFLSGLRPDELDIARGLIEKRRAPEIVAARTAVQRAFSEAEAGWRNAANQIRERCGLPKSGNGAVAA